MCWTYNILTLIWLKPLVIFILSYVPFNTTYWSSGIMDDTLSILSRGGDEVCMKYVCMRGEFPCCNSRAQSTGKQVELNNQQPRVSRHNLLLKTEEGGVRRWLLGSYHCLTSVVYGHLASFADHYVRQNSVECQSTALIMEKSWPNC